MKTTSPIIFIVLSAVSVAIAQSKDEQTLLDLDVNWEKALLTADVTFLENLLAKDFVWVHNHVSLINGKESVVNQAKKIRDGGPNNTRARDSRDRKVAILGSTAVITGYTVVDRGPAPTTYHFMRTYAKVKGKFYLLGNHTMAIPDDELESK